LFNINEQPVHNTVGRWQNSEVNENTYRCQNSSHI